MASVSAHRKVVAVIMTYNCARLVRKAHDQIPKELVDDIIATDDASSDDSHDEAVALGIPAYRNEKNKGYGGNLKTGFRLALERGADYIVEVHGDGQFHTSSLAHAVPLMERGAGLILGSRFIVPGKAREKGMPLVRYLANRGLSFIDRLVLRLPLSEFHTGFRIYSRELLSKVPWEDNSDDYLFSFQIIAQAAYAGVPVGEVPVEADYHGEHTSHSLSGASVYAVRTFEVLAHYLLAKSHLRHNRLFPPARRTKEP